MSTILQSGSRPDVDGNDDKTKEEENGKSARMMRPTAAPGNNTEATGDNKRGTRKTPRAQAPGVKLPPGFPLDRGWAWAILAGHFIISFLLAGYALFLGTFLMEFVEMFQVSVSAASSVLGVHAACSGLGNVVATHVLLPRLGPKKTVLIGACVLSAVTCSLSVAPNMIYINIAHIFIGASFPCMNLPSVTLLNTYFRARRAFAMSLALTGLSVAAISVPPLTQYFISSYGPRGALLLVGGLQMHGLISGCLLRPVSYYAVRKKQPPKANEQNGEHSQQKAEDLHTTQPIVTSGQHCQKNSLDTELESVTTELLDDSDRPKADHPTASQLAPEQDDRLEVRPSSTELDLNVVTVESDSSASGAPQNGLRKAETDKQMRRVSCEDDQHQAEPLLSQRQETSSTLPSTNTESRDPSEVSKAIQQCEQLSPTAGQVPAMESGSEAAGMGCCRCVPSTSLYRNRLFWLLVVYAPLALSSSKIGIYLPALAVSQGISRPEAALLLSVTGGVGLVSRMGHGYLADSKLVKSTHLVAICVTITGVVAQFCRFYTSFGLLVAMAVIQGMLGNAGQTLNTVVIVDLMGLQHLPKVLGLVMFINAGWNSLTHPLIGAIVDATGSFAAAYNYTGACLLAAALVLMMEPVARRLEARRLQKHNSPLGCTHRSEEEG